MPPPSKAPYPRLTHFLCIPLITAASKPQLLSSLSSFRTNILKETKENPSGIPGAAIRPLGTLHLTLGVMSLGTTERVREALEVLAGIDLRALLAGAGGSEDLGRRVERAKGEWKVEGLRITLRGLESMHMPSRTSILYTAPIDRDRRVYSFCLALRSIFQDAGLMIEDSRPLLLHATLLNMIYVPGVRGEEVGKEKGEGHGKRKAKLVVDARRILGDHKEVEWMRDVRVEKVAICRMGAQKGRDGEERYVVEGEVEMPV